MRLYILSLQRLLQMGMENCMKNIANFSAFLSFLRCQTRGENTDGNGFKEYSDNEILLLFEFKVRKEWLHEVKVFGGIDRWVSSKLMIMDNFCSLRINQYFRRIRNRSKMMYNFWQEKEVYQCVILPSKRKIFVTEMGEGSKNKYFFDERPLRTLKSVLSGDHIFRVHDQK